MKFKLPGISVPVEAVREENREKEHFSHQCL